MMDIKTIGFIGIGNMGRPMASNLVKGGYQVVAYDADAKRAVFGLEQAGAHLLAGRQHGDDRVRLSAEFGERRGGFCADIRGELRGACRVGIIGDDLIAALLKVGRHRPAHIADADEADGPDVHHSSPCP